MSPVRRAAPRLLVGVVLFHDYGTAVRIIPPASASAPSHGRPSDGVPLI
jgi:hypothetical protein